MKHPFLAIAVAFGLVLMGLFVALSTVAKAHEQETSVDWDVAYANVRVTSVPLYTHTTVLPVPRGTPSVSAVAVAGVYPTIAMATGDYLVITWSFQYVGGAAVRGDLFWITRLGLDFATLGRYIAVDGGLRTFIGSSSFALTPNSVYDATLVLRSIQPNFRHLHVGLSVQNVGNIPAAPTTILPSGEIPAGGPILYGAFTDASGPVVEPLQGITIGNSPFSGTFILLATWPWAVAGFVAQVVIGFAFIGFMYWYGRREQKKGAGA